MERNNYSRVYINPNFNRGIVGCSQNVTNMASNNNMYLNPNFSNTQNTKIYINPNFIPSIPHPVQVIGPCPLKVDEMVAPNIARTGDDYLCTSTVTVPTKPLTQMQVPDAKISRYRLVRHNENKPPESKSEKPESHTIKLSKYKSVRISDVKSNLDRVKQPVKKFSSSSKCPQSSSQIYNQKEGIMNTSHKALNTQFTYTKKKDIARKPHNNKHQSTNMSVKYTSKIKIRKIKIKSNKPCRLFRKYGKCIRNDRGVCKYLHDRKHVSICRKFLKGICHDKDCLLSHELSDKKMPTCYFYLQGMCTKEACPYLHVKVNEKAIVCPEFKKGYCEKGSTCLYRHVEATKKSRKRKFVDSKIKSPYQFKIKVRVDNFKTQKDPVQSNKMSNVAQDQTTVTDCRYYKEAIVNEDSCSESYHVIKPSRCKLGTLPSFIKL